MVGIRRGTKKKGNPDYEAYKDSKGVTRYRKRAGVDASKGSAKAVKSASAVATASGSGGG